MWVRVSGAEGRKGRFRVSEATKQTLVQLVEKSFGVPNCRPARRLEVGDFLPDL